MKDEVTPATPNQHQHFEAFWKQCIRRTAKEKTRSIYGGIIASGKATPQQLLHGMMRYAGEREGEDGRYTKTPATWLEEGCWHDDPGANSPKKNRVFDRSDWRDRQDLTHVAFAELRARNEQARQATSDFLANRVRREKAAGELLEEGRG